MPITKRGRQNLSTALAYYYFLHNNRMITGFQASVRGSKVILSDGAKPLLEISAGGVNSLAYDPYDPAFYDAARKLTIRLALARYGHGTTLAVQGSWGDRRAYRRAGFKLINDNVSARVGRFILGLT